MIRFTSSEKKRNVIGEGESTQRATASSVIIAAWFQVLKSWKQQYLYSLTLIIFTFVLIYPCIGLCVYMNSCSHVSQPLYFIQDENSCSYSKSADLQMYYHKIVSMRYLTEKLTFQSDI